jgi:group II intron reverse transcriptase/maturase
MHTNPQQTMSFGVKMTMIQDVLNMNNLRLAWEAVAENQGIPGVDDITINQWRRNWEERLVNLARSVRNNTYHPKKLRLRSIPKRNHSGERTLRIPTLTDRVLQRAVSQVMMPFYEPMFLDCSFGYRPHRGLKNAVECILILRENGFQHILSADIDAFFDSVDHELLLRFLQSDLPDESLLPLISIWLEGGATLPNHSKGIPQGSPLSPLLANIYLHRFDLSMYRGHTNIVRYADDFVVCCKDKIQVERSRTLVENALNSLSLRLEPTKTSITCFEKGFDFLGVHFFRDTYSYTWEDKEIKVKGDEVDWLFSTYGGEYD